MSTSSFPNQPGVTRSGRGGGRAWGGGGGPPAGGGAPGDVQVGGRRKQRGGGAHKSGGGGRHPPRRTERDRRLVRQRAQVIEPDHTQHPRPRGLVHGGRAR